MSVLNQMLRDLEKRGAMPEVVAAAGTATVARPALATDRGAADLKRRWAWTGVLAVGAFLVGVHSWLSYRVQDAGTVRAPLGAQQFAGVTGPSGAPAPAAATTSTAKDNAAPAHVAAKPAPATNNVAKAAPARAGTPPAPRVAVAAPAPKAKPVDTRKAAPADTTKPVPAATAPAAPATAAALVAPSTNAMSSEMDRAADLIARGRATEAMEILSQVLARQPTHAAARSSLAALLAEAGRREQALHVLLAGSEIDAGRFAAPAAQLQAELGDVTGALGTLNRVPPAFRTAAFEALFAGLAQRAGDHMSAIAGYRRALAFPQTEPVWWVGLGVSLEATGEPGEARGAYARAAGESRLPADVRRYVTERLTVLQSLPSQRADDARKGSLANVF